jgi:hypothetical protein
MNKLLMNAVLAVVVMMGVGCASIVDGGQNNTITVKTKPAGAKVTVLDKNGEAVCTQTTPAILTLKRGNGFIPLVYTLQFEIPGHYPKDLMVKSRINGWYFGNIFFGGVIGLLIVDPGTSAMWSLSPNEVSWNFVPNIATLTPEQLSEAEVKANPPPKPRPTGRAAWK